MNARAAIATDGPEANAGSTMTARRALAYLRPHKLALLGAGACILVQTLLGLAPFVIVKALIDHLENPSQGSGKLILLAAAAVGLALLNGLVGLVRAWIVLRMTNQISADLRRQIVHALLGQSISYFTGARGGELMSRLLNDVAVTETVLGDTALSFASNLITAVIFVLAMAVVQWQLAVVTVVIVPPVVLALRRAGRPIFRTRMDLQERRAAFTVHAQELLSLSGIMLVKSFGRQHSERERSDALIDELRVSTVRAGMTTQWTALGLSIVQLLAPIVLLLCGAWLVEHDYASLGTVVAFVTVLVLRFGVALASAGNSAVTIIGSLPAWQRVFAVLDTEPEVRELPGARELDLAVGAVRLRNVTYSYRQNGRPALDDVDLDVAPGQLVALVGPSGAGKTTMTSMIARFYDPRQGSVEIDGHDLRELTLDSVSRAIGLVLQETYLFHASLRENLLYARPDADEAALAAAVADAHLDHVLAELPDGLDTIVGERGHRLSGGEKQRVAIARVILKDSPILILDEATSHLDSASERYIQDALSRLFAGRTSFVIAHRLSTVLAADLIVVLDRGRIVERGTHHELLSMGGLYASLYELQFSGREDELLSASSAQSSAATSWNWRRTRAALSRKRAV
jgi:ATP-binding cassette, subfamily B, bacterial